MRLDVDMMRPVAPTCVVVAGAVEGRGEDDRGGVAVSLVREPDFFNESFAVVPFAIGVSGVDDGETARVTWRSPSRSRIPNARTRYGFGCLSASQGVTLGSRRPVRALNVGSRCRGQGMILKSWGTL